MQVRRVVWGDELIATPVTENTSIRGAYFSSLEIRAGGLDSFIVAGETVVRFTEPGPAPAATDGSAK